MNILRISRRARSLALVGTVTIAVMSAPAQAATSYGPIYRLTTGGNDYFFNYDFLNEGARSNNVDWAVSLYVYNGASIDRVKYMLDRQGFGYNSSTSMHSLAKDESTYRWDNDNGKKKYSSCPGPGQTALHYRLYADNDQYMWHPDAGTYVYATTHADRAECARSGRLHYASEAVEGIIVESFRQLGCRATHDAYYFFNREPYRAQGIHVWENNGYASYVNTGWDNSR